MERDIVAKNGARLPKIGQLPVGCSPPHCVTLDLPVSYSLRDHTSRFPLCRPDAFRRRGTSQGSRDRDLAREPDGRILRDRTYSRNRATSLRLRFYGFPQPVPTQRPRLGGQDGREKYGPGWHGRPLGRVAVLKFLGSLAKLLNKSIVLPAHCICLPLVVTKNSVSKLIGRMHPHYLLP